MCMSHRQAERREVGAPNKDHTHNTYNITGKVVSRPLVSTDNEQIRREPLAVLIGNRYLLHTNVMQPKAAGHTWPAGFHYMASG
jgi:hypothetical protein